MNIFNKQYEILKGRRDNFRFEFNNKIPISRGLGSSSAVIVAALASAFVVAKERYSKRKILNLALEYEPHPDNITPAVMGGFNVIMCGRMIRYIAKRGDARLPQGCISYTKLRNQYSTGKNS